MPAPRGASRTAVPTPQAPAPAVRAVARKDGGGGGADACPDTAASPYKGVSFTGTTCADLDKLGVTWFYDWGTSSSCKTNAQFVPMVWGGWTATANPTPPAKLATAGAKIILGFNEPDHADQAHLTVAAALALWPAMDQPGFERVGSPATASDGQAWFEQFMTGVRSRSCASISSRCTGTAGTPAPARTSAGWRATSNGPSSGTSRCG